MSVPAGSLAQRHAFSSVRRGPLLERRGLVCGALAAAIAAGVAAAHVVTHRMAGLFNDFDFYWAAGRLLAQGRDPYDVAAARGVLAAAGLHPASTLGYSYPLLFAYPMQPLSALPPLVAALVFSALSLAAFALAVALLISALPPLPWPELGALGCAAGCFAPVTGSLWMGQVNLLVLLPLALAFRGAAPAASVAVAAAVKLFPVVALLTFLPRGREGRRGLMVGAACFLVLALAPSAVAGFERPRLLDMFTPDGYYTDESINGFLSRLAGAEWHTSPALVHGLPVEPVMVVAAALLGAAALAVVLRRRGAPREGCLSLLLVYGAIAAPRSSLWDFAPLLIALVWCWPRVRARPAGAAALIAGWALIQAQQEVYDIGPAAQAASSALGLLGSLGLLGALVAGVVCAVLVAMAPPAET